MTISIPGYRFLEQVAAGASGTVWRAVQESLQRIVAVKVLAPGLFGAAETRARFLREARLQANLTHPNLVALFDAGFVGECPYLVTEFVPGGTLRDALDRPEALPLAEAVRLAREIASGLGHAHDAGIAHRDLKPENVLLGAERQAKVADFGLAKTLAGDDGLQTASGVVLGTPGYIAPEVISGAAATAASDLYALGVLLFEMLAGRRPFEGADVAEVLARQVRDETPELRCARSDLPETLEILVRRCLSKRPADRPVSAASIARELAQLEAAGIRSMSRPAAPQTMTAPRARHLRDELAHTRIERPGLPGMGPSPRLSGGNRRLIAGALLAMGVLGGVLLWRGPELPGPVPPGSPASDGPATSGTTSPEASPDLPTVLRVAAGTDCLRLRLSRPAPPGLMLRYRAAGEQQTRSVAIPAVTTEPLVKGFQPATSYSGHLELGERQRAFDFTTPGTLPESNATRLAVGDCDQIAVAARGRDVAVAWTTEWEKRSAAVHLRESFDSGLTWGPDRRIGGNGARHSTLCWSASGLLAAWNTDSGGVLRFRPDRSGEWGAEFVSALSGFSLLRAAEDRIEGLATEGSKQPYRRAWVRIRVGPAGILGEPLPLSWLPEADYTGDAVSICGGVAALAGVGDQEQDLFWTVCPEPSRGTWSPLARMPRADAVVSRSRLGLAATTSVIVLAHDAAKRVSVQLSRDCGRTFSGVVDVMPGKRMIDVQTSPAISESGGRFLLAFLRLPGLGEYATVVSLWSADGSTWSPFSRELLPVSFPSGVGTCAAVSDGRFVAIVKGRYEQGLAAISVPLPANPARLLPDAIHGPTGR